MSEETKNTESQTNSLANTLNTALDILVNNENKNENDQDESKTSDQQQNSNSDNANTPSNSDKSIEETKSDKNDSESQSPDLQESLDNLINAIQPNSSSNDLNGTSSNESNIQSNEEGDTFCTEIDQDKINPKADPPSRTNAQNNQKAQQEEHDIPPTIKPYVTHEKDSLTYRALCGESLIGLTPEVKASLIGNLNKYIDICIDHGLVGEAYYIQAIIEDLKEENSINRSIAEKALSDIDQRLEEANAELEEKTKLWEQQEEIYEQEKMNECQSLNERYQAAMEELDSSWTTPEKQQHYTKPSSSLLNLRRMLQQMIKAKRFEDVDKLAAVIDVKEKEEAQQAAEKMKLDYEVADAKLRDIYSMEQVVINGKYESKQNTLIRMKDVSLRPILQRIENLKRSRQKAATTAKNLSGNCVKSRSCSALSPNTRTATRQATSRQNGSKSTLTPTRVVPTTRVPAFVQNPKLSLPSFTPKKRDPLVSLNSPNATISKPKTRQTNSRLWNMGYP